jgi:hypothetical protein
MSLLSADLHCRAIWIFLLDAGLIGHIGEQDLGLRGNGIEQKQSEKDSNGPLHSRCKTTFFGSNHSALHW